MKHLFFFSFCSLIFFASAAKTNAIADRDSTAAAKTVTTAAGSTSGFMLGVQMWTFNHFTFTEALDKVDSAGIRYIEAFWGQRLGGNMTGAFGADMDVETRTQLKALLQKKNIRIIAMGVIAPQNRAEWIKAFELAKEFGLSYITSEPNKTQWDMIDSLAGMYNINIAIHDHPRPNPYATPDSVLAAIKGHKHIGACADVGHWARNGIDPVAGLQQLEGHIYGVHLKDITTFNDTHAADTVVSKGVVNFPAILAELKRQNFKGMMSIEQESNWLHNLPDVMLTKQYWDAQVSKLK